MGLGSSNQLTHMKQVVAISGWAFFFWFVPSITFAFILGSPSGPAAPGTVHHFGATEALLRFYLPMGCGVLGMGLGMLGLLPGTGSDDAGRNED